MSNRKATLTIDGQAPIELPILQGTLGQDVIDIGTLGSHNVFTYDPGFSATAACQSDITYIDGNKAFCCTAVTRLSSWLKSQII